MEPMVNMGIRLEVEQYEKIGAMAKNLRSTRNGIIRLLIDHAEFSASSPKVFTGPIEEKNNRAAMVIETNSAVRVV